MMAEDNAIEKLVKEALAEQRWDIIYKLVMKREEEFPHLCEASIDHRVSWQLKITLDKEFEKKEEQILADTQLGIDEPYRKFARTLQQDMR